MRTPAISKIVPRIVPKKCIRMAGYPLRLAGLPYHFSGWPLRSRMLSNPSLPGNTT
jgi:hypothetical protein